MKTCKKCGANVQDDAVFCNVCGKRLIKKENKSCKKSVMIILLGIVFLLGLALGFFGGMKINSDENIEILSTESDTTESVSDETILDETLLEYKEEAVEADKKNEEKQNEQTIQSGLDGEYTYTFIGDEVRAKEGLIYEECPDIYNFVFFDDNDSGRYAPDQELEMGKDYSAVRFLKAHPRDVRIIDSRIDGMVLTKVTCSKYLQDEKIFTPEEKIGKDYYGMEFGHTINISADYFQTLEAGMYVIYCYQEGINEQHIWPFYLAVHDESESVDNFRVELLTATQFYSEAGKNDVLFYVMNTPYPIKDVISYDRILDKTEYELIFDGYGIVFHSDFLEQYKEKIYLPLIFRMENGKKIEAKIVFLDQS